MNIGSSETTREAPHTVALVNSFNFQEYVLPEHKNYLDFSFLEWFIGFSEGDGCFCSRIEDNRVRLSFEIGQKDAKLIHKIRTMLGFGTVSSFTRQSERYWRYKVEDKKGVQRIMTLFNGNLVLPKKYIQFQHWVTMGKALCPPSFLFKEQRVHISLQTGWLSGFLEAEGCFYAAFRVKDKLFPDTWDFDQKFTLTQKDVYGESLILQEIIVLFQSNVKLHLVKKPTCYRIEFCSLKAHTILVNYLTKFPFLGRKKITFRRWWRIYLRRKNPKNEFLTLKTITKLKKLCSQINL
jgi:hypothetical protein